MSFHIEVSAEQARAVAALAEDNGEAVALRQLVAGQDVYATVHGRQEGFRIARDGTLTPVAHVLPAP